MNESLTRQGDVQIYEGARGIGGDEYIECNVSCRSYTHKAVSAMVDKKIAVRHSRYHGPYAI